MAFSNSKGTSNGLSKRMGNHDAEDEKSNTKGSSGSAQRLGPKGPTTKTVSGPSVSGLNRGVPTTRK